ncbi:MAG: PQQ-binding-like beta-propeller repeat protein, partial [Thermoguttaceae bacterium]
MKSLKILFLFFLIISVKPVFAQEPAETVKSAPKTAAELRAEREEKRKKQIAEKETNNNKTDKSESSAEKSEINISNTATAEQENDSGDVANVAESQKSNKQKNTNQYDYVEKEDQARPKQKLLLSPDRTALRPIEQAKQLIERDRLQDAVQLLGSVLEGNEDFFIEPDSLFKKEENATNKSKSKQDVVLTDRTTTATLKKVAEGMIRDLPEEGRRLYTMQYEPLAKRLLNNAVDSCDVEQIEKVASKYFYTQAGQDAAFLLAMLHYEQGARGSATILFRRIAAESETLDPYEPTFSLTFAACEKSLGNEKNAVHILEDFFRRNPNPRIRLSGEKYWNPESVAEIVEKIGEWETMPNMSGWLNQRGWLLPNGVSNQNPQVEASPPLLELTWKLSNITQPKLISDVKMVEGQLRYGKETFLPAARPITVGDFLVFRGYEGLVAVNSKNGKRVWIGREKEYVMPLASTMFLQPNQHFNINQNNSGLSQILLRMRLWHDQSLGSITSDGSLVFNIENEPNLMNLRMGGFRGGFGMGGQQPEEDPRERIATTITARDAKTGEIVWQVGKAVLVQKLLSQIEEKLKDEHKQTAAQGVIPGMGMGMGGGMGGGMRPFPRRAGPVPAPGRIRVAPNVPAIQLPAVPANEIILEIAAKDEAENGAKSDTDQSETDNSEAGTDAIGAEVATETPQADAAVVEKTVITNEEQFLGDTYFLGPPLPVLGNLFVIGENAGALRLFVLDAKTGKLIRHQGLVEPGTSIETDWLRRFRGPIPSYSEGILVCPTGAGAVVALDATNGKLLWCYTYGDDSDEKQEAQNRGMGMGGRGAGFGKMLQFNNGIPFNFSGGTHIYQYLTDYVGWQIPATIISDGKLILAPADRPMLYCFDLLTGKLIWKRSKGVAKYVACVHDKKVIIAAKNSLIALDISSGKQVWDDSALAPLQPQPAPDMYGYSEAPQRPRIVQNKQAESTLQTDTDSSGDETSGNGGNGNSANEEATAHKSTPFVEFEKDSSPAGVGVKYGNLYMVPLNNNSIVVVDLDSGQILKTWRSIGAMPLGNLVAIGGKVFSQTPTSLECFDQIDSIKNWANDRLKEDENDAVAQMQLGRIDFAEGKPDMAIQRLWHSVKTKSTPQNRALLRNMLTATYMAVETEEDFMKYRKPLDELETLNDSPEAFVQLLHAFAVGCLKTTKNFDDNACANDFYNAFCRLIEIDQEYSVMRNIGPANQILLSRWIGKQVKHLCKFDAALIPVDEYSATIDNLANKAIERTLQKYSKDGKTIDPTQLSRSELDAVENTLERHLEYFGSLPQSKTLPGLLIDIYMLQNKCSEMEFFIHRLALAQNIKLELLDKQVISKFSELLTIAAQDAAKNEVKNEASEVTPESAVEPATVLKTVPAGNNLADLQRLQNYIAKLANKFEEQGDLVNAVRYYKILAAPEVSCENVDVLFPEMKIASGKLKENKFAELFDVHKWLPGVVVFKRLVKVSDESKSDTENLNENTDNGNADNNEVAGVVEQTNNNDEENNTENISTISASDTIADSRVESDAIWNPWETTEDVTAMSPGLRQYFPNQVSLVPVPYFGPGTPDAAANESNFGSYNFSLLRRPNIPPQMVCFDTAGRKVWSLDITADDDQDANFNMYFPSQMFDGIQYNVNEFVKGFNHILYLVQGKRIYAIDTLKLDKSGSPSIVWTQTTQMPFVPTRIWTNAVPIYQLNQNPYYSGMYNDTGQLVDQIFINSQVVCFQDVDTLKGVNPVTGELMWVNESLSSKVCLTGDDEYVYVIRPRLNSPTNARNAFNNYPYTQNVQQYEVVVLDAMTGEEVTSGNAPA